MAASNVGDLASAKQLSPPVRAFRARVVSFLLDPTPDKWSHHCCEDLEDVANYLKLAHFEQSVVYTTKSWHRIEDYGFICEMEVDPASVTVDIHHLDSWYNVVENMDTESQLLYNQLREQARHSPNTPPSQEYEEHHQRFLETAKRAVASYTPVINDFFAGNKLDHDRLKKFPSLVNFIVEMTEPYGFWEAAIPENLRERIAGFSYSWMKWLIFRIMGRRARTTPSEDLKQQAMWEWIADRTVMYLETDAGRWKKEFHDFLISKRNLRRNFDELKEMRSGL